MIRIGNAARLRPRNHRKMSLHHNQTPTSTGGNIVKNFERYVCSINCASILKQNMRGSLRIAAVLHGEDRRVELSESFGNTSMLFSAAHELAHILLHPVKKHHRERPVDGSAALYRYPHIQRQHRQEWEANKFAASFLMPMDRVIDEYDLRIPIKPLSLSDDVAFALKRKSMQELHYLSDAKNLAMQVAKADHFDGQYFEYSLCDKFNVSREAMALRLLEAKLIQGSLHEEGQRSWRRS